MRYLKMLSILLALVFCLQGCGQNQPNTESDLLDDLLADFSKAIENGVPSDMRLTLYWAPPYLEQLYPIRYKEDFIDGVSETILDSTKLADQIDQLQKIASADLQLPEKSNYKDLHICYWIETDAGTVLDVEISYEDWNITVNGVEVAYDPAFFELVAPYMDTWEYDPADWSIDYDSIEDDW